MASGALFFVNGMVYGNWLPRIPELKDQLGLSNTNLGITLLGGGIGDHRAATDRDGGNPVRR
ncbi:MAG: hypothetical protein EBW96_01330 [Actinobacteria bacterium]|nr:hypothetical protein [Actinomycetota bacterium]